MLTLVIEAGLHRLGLEQSDRNFIRVNKLISSSQRAIAQALGVSEAAVS
ncbi:MAG TPA: hypothetical protein VFD58_06875 [Blastocatellia bacterium]|nr:hypothetical protein [Blastocatellia bacterium]